MRHCKHTLIIPFLLGIALIGYMLPWIITPTNALSLGAYDLAEWASLHPIVRQTAPYLWSTLALRLPLAVIGILLASTITTRKNRIIALIIITLTTIALLPPLEFFTTYQNDDNYRQQLIIAIVTILVGSIALSKRLNNVKPIVQSTLSAIGAIGAALGLSQTFNLIQNFNLPTHVGVSGYLTIIALGLLTISYITKQSR